MKINVDMQVNQVVTRKVFVPMEYGISEKDWSRVRECTKTRIIKAWIKNFVIKPEWRLYSFNERK